MAKRVLDVGNCGVDHTAIRQMLMRSFGVEVVQADDGDEALAELKKEGFDLVLVNRKLDKDYSDGLEIIKRIKADPAVAATPAMLITNYAEHQQTAVAAGAEPGFGKREIGEPQTLERLGRFLGAPTAARP